MKVAGPEMMSIFCAALERSTAAERAAYLEAACGQDAELRARVEALLRAHDAAGGFLPEGDRPDPHGTIDEPLTERPGTAIGPYKLLEQIGEGGFGFVFLAEQMQPVRRKVALKVLKPGMDTRQVVARFEAERQALAIMDHPNIAKVHDGGATASGRPFFVMELVQGVPITRYCDEHQLPVRQRLELFLHACEAVQHAHQKGVIHRDLKPSNILVGNRDDKPVLKVIDFGIAKAMGQQLTDMTVFTGASQMMGTPLYMSPEQAGKNAVDIDTRSDIYSLGVMLYELLTGTTPIDKGRLQKASYDEMRRIIREEEPLRPSARLDPRNPVPARRDRVSSRDVRGELDWIVMKALDKDRKRRYETANGLAMDVQRYLADEPVLACPPSVRYRVGKFARKYRKGLATGAAFTLVLIVGTVISILLAMRAINEKNRAEAGEQLASERLVQVKAEQQRAEDETQVARAVQDFLQNRLLGQADVTVQANALRFGGFAAEANRNITVRELLDRAAHTLTPDMIDKYFPNQPLVQAELLETLGNTYRGVGEFARAVEFLQRAMALEQRQRGAEDPRALTTLVHLAHANLAAGKPLEVIAMLEPARAIAATKLGSDHPETLRLLTVLAQAYAATKKMYQAIQLLEQVKDSTEKKLGANHEDTLAALNALAGAYFDASRPLQVIQLLEPVQQSVEATFGPDHLCTLAVLDNLAGGYQLAGKPLQAIPLYERVRDGAAKTLGPDHPFTLNTLNNLAVGYYRTAQFDKAISLLQEVHQQRKKKLGGLHPHTLETLLSLGNICFEAGRLDEAIQALEEVYRDGKAHNMLHSAGGDLARAYVKAGRTADAVEVMQEQLVEARKAFPPDSPALAYRLALYGDQMLNMQLFADAEAVLRESLAIREKLVKNPVNNGDGSAGFNTMQVPVMQSLLAVALLGQKKYAEAEPLLLGCYETFKKHQKSLTPIGKSQLADTIRWLINLYDATGQNEKAAAFRRALEDLKKDPDTKIKDAAKKVTN